MADQNEPPAYVYAIRQPTGDERDRSLSRVALARSRENPVGVAKLVTEQIGPGEVQNEAAISVLHQWALRDPTAALGWAQLRAVSGKFEAAFARRTLDPTALRS